MGHVRSEKAYQFYQELIRRLMADVGEAVLYFDYFAWNLVDRDDSRQHNDISLASDLLESNPKFQAIVSNSKASPRNPFPPQKTR
jgi:hypothetical protein